MSESAGKRGKPNSFEDGDAFKLALIEAYKDTAVCDALSAAVLKHIEVMADKVTLRIDARLKALTDQIKEKDARIDTLEASVRDLQVKLDDQEQYSRREALRVDGIPEVNNESTDALILELCNEGLKLDPPLKTEDISRSHRSGDRAKFGKRTILVKFSSYRIRDRVIRARKHLKSLHRDGQAPIFMNEDLTKRRAHLAYLARGLKKEKRVLDTWTWDGLIRVKDLHNKIHVIDKESDLTKFKRVAVGE